MHHIIFYLPFGKKRNTQTKKLEVERIKKNLFVHQVDDVNVAVVAIVVAAAVVCCRWGKLCN